MRKAILLLLFAASSVMAEELKTVYNPFTQKLDYVTKMSSSSQNIYASTITAHRVLYVSDQIGLVNNLFINPPGNQNLNLVTGQYNIGINGALSSLTSSNSNTFFGAGAGGSITDGNVAGCGPGVGDNLGFGDDTFHFDPGCFNVGMGHQAGQYMTQGNFNVIVGNRGVNGDASAPITSGNRLTAIGYRTAFSNPGNFDNWTCIGTECWVNGSNQLSLCSDTFPCTKIWLNSPQQTTNNTNGQSLTFQVQQASGTNRSGGDLTFAAGAGTGSGAGGWINFQVSTPSASGTTINPPFTVLSISTATTGTASRAMCWKTATTLGYCSSVVGVAGDCTCN